MTCHVFGNLSDVTGSTVSMDVRVIVRRNGSVVAQDGRAIVPTPISVPVGEGGSIAVDLYAGEYDCEAILPSGRYHFILGVPDAPTARLDECIDQMPELTPSLVQEAKEAAAAAQAAAASIKGLPAGGTTGQVLAKASSNDYDAGWVDPASGTGGTVSVEVGVTTTAGPGTEATVTNSGTATALVLDFTIPRGADGAAGPQGPAGADGPQGPAGVDGAQGPAGPAGEQGPQGLPGADGASAYEIAVAAGFAGTEAEWLTSLIGQTGEQGPVGPTGADGAQGPQGEQGMPGADGADGADGQSMTVLAFDYADTAAYDAAVSANAANPLVLVVRYASA